MFSIFVTGMNQENTFIFFSHFIAYYYVCENVRTCMCARDRLDGL